MELVRDKVPDSMSTEFHVRRATPADAEIIGTHRARMFHDMGDIPDHLFEEFQARSREHCRTANERRICRLARESRRLVRQNHRRRRRAVAARHAASINRSEWRAWNRRRTSRHHHQRFYRTGMAPARSRRALMQHIIDWSRTENDSIGLSCTPPTKAARSTKNSALS